MLLTVILSFTARFVFSYTLFSRFNRNTTVLHSAYCFWIFMIFCTFSPVSVPLFIDSGNERTLARINQLGTTILFIENLPQFAVQIYLVTSINPTALPLAAMFFSLQALISKLVAIFVRQFVARGWITSVVVIEEIPVREKTSFVWQ
eukprot:c34220_g1_i1.p1 GENE.c34220_g1_i1~~c34220_g1_i1.p1  ORF type:complete len:147 (+),score=49.78 c34220_g1_i1:587-1027(+)